MLGLLFPVTLFLSAFLLFSIQPMAAKVLLPVYGGTPAVWTVCMLFFQLILLAAYGYVWLISLSNKPALWRTFHTALIVLALLTMPLMFHPGVMQGVPELTICYELVAQIGLPLLVIGTTAPLLQFAYSQSGVKNASDPYFLYIASNCGSLIALLAYPLFIERFIGLGFQFYLWSLGFALYLALLLLILYSVEYKPLNASTLSQTKYPWRQMGSWLFLSFLPCSLMLGVTLYITTDIAATPLFWVIPLALYLISFILTFSTKTIIPKRWIKNSYVYFLAATVAFMLWGPNPYLGYKVLLIHITCFFVLALLCHRELYLSRPKPRLLPLFYFCLALGGVLAGVFNGLIAPHLFNQVYEYPLALALTLLLLPTNKEWLRWSLASVVLILLIVPWHSRNILVQNRSFYAVNRVEDRFGVHIFFSQSTIHGLQASKDDNPPDGFRSYYGAVKPVIEALHEQFQVMTATIMGLGTGNMLCQFKVNDEVHVIEIDQQVIDIAKNPKLFTYVRDCLPKTHLIKNDGRLAITNIPHASQNLLVLDAFNSDAVPVHLMTLDAFTMYKSRITSNGVILINLSNRHLHLLPVINAIGHSLDFLTLHIVHHGEKSLGQFDSEWALLTANQDLAFKIMQNSNWQFVADENQVLWTDDYSNIISLLRS